MKHGSIRTKKTYPKKGIIKFQLEGRKNGIWLPIEENKKIIIFDLEYDACGKLLSMFERRI